MVAVERGVEVTHDLAHFIAGATNDDAVRATAVGDGGAFLEKFRVGHYVKLQRAPGLFQGLVDMGGEGIAGAHGHGGFLHQDQRLLAVAGNGVTNGEHLAQVSRAIFAWRRAHGDKQYLAVFDGGFFVAGKTQALAFEVFAHQGGQPRLENTDVALLQRLDLFLVNVHADHIVADFRQNRRLHQAYITTTKYTDFHAQFLRVRRELMVSTPRMTSVTPRVFERVKLSWNTGRLAASRYTNA